VGTYSKGMRQRLGLASVLIKDPKLVILDEPTTGIDPEGTEQVLDLIRRMSREMGVSILLSSHLLYQVQQVCDRVGIMFKGKMVAQGSIEDIGRQVLGEREGVMKLTYSFINEEALKKLDGIEGITEKRIANNTIIVKFDETRKLDIVREVVMRGFLPIEVKGKEYSLEEIYIRYFERGDRKNEWFAASVPQELTDQFGSKPFIFPITPLGNSECKFLPGCTPYP